jgi:hypothetical protein
MGNDLILFLLACEEHPYVYYIAQALTHFRAHTSSFTTALAKSSPHIFSLCYLSTFANFISGSGLKKKEKRLLNALLIVSIALNPRIAFHSGSPWRTYARLFPAGYQCNEFDFLNASVWMFAGRQLLRLTSRGLARLMQMLNTPVEKR